MPLSLHDALIEQAQSIAIQRGDRENTKKRKIARTGGAAPLQSVPGRGQWVILWPGLALWELLAQGWLCVLDSSGCI